MDVMPLIPETKMADARKQSVSGTHWPGEPKTTSALQFRPAFLQSTPWQEFSINTSSSNTLSLFTFSLTEPIHSLQCDFQREHYHSLISTNSSQPPQKYICHATILLLVTSFRWDFFQLLKQQKFRQITERQKQTGWEKTRSSQHTLLRCYRKYLVNTHRTLLLFSLFCSISVNYTHTNTHTGIYVEQY